MSKLHVILIGNYAPDEQQSMGRFAELLFRKLPNPDVTVELLQPGRILGRFARNTTNGGGKWLGYVDKYVLFPQHLRRVVNRRRMGREISGPGGLGRTGTTIVHICDHSNAMYVNSLASVPTVVTCHDLLAVRGSRGDETVYCSASRGGAVLQDWICRSLRKVDAVACVSEATAGDFQNLIHTNRSKLHVIPMGLNAKFKRLSNEEIAQNLSGVNLNFSRPYLLHVGSSLVRKNRKAVIKTLQRLKDTWSGIAVFAGDPLPEEVRCTVSDEINSGRIVEVVRPSGSLLNALYCGAHALLFPSYAEGFGWPVLEALVCGCPVISSNRTSLPEVGGPGAIFVDPDDHFAMARAVLELEQSDCREQLISNGTLHAAKFQTEIMIKRYLDLYRSLAQTGI